MKTYICTKKVYAKYNKIKYYVLKQCESNDSIRTIGAEYKFTRKEIIAMIRDTDNSKILNLCLTYNNRVTHKGPLSMKALNELEE